MFGTNNLLTMILSHYSQQKRDAEEELPFTFINRHRLPTTEQLQGNELAHREDMAVSEDELWGEIRERIVCFIAVTTLGTFAIHFVALVPFWWALTGACIVGALLALGYLIWSAEVRLLRVFLALIVPPLSVLPAYFLAAGFLSQRNMASLILTALALALLFSAWFSAHPIAFWRQWLLCAEWLKPETRHQFWQMLREDDSYAGRVMIKLIRNGIFAIFVLLSVVYLAGYSTRRAAFALLLIGFFFTDFRPWRAYFALRRVLSRALTYTGRESGAAGVWIPKASLQKRVWFAGATVVILHLALSTGLTLYAPTQLVAPKPLVPAPTPTPTPSSKKKTSRVKALPSPSPSQALAKAQPEQKEQPLSVGPTTDTYAGVRTFLRASWRSRSISMQGVFDFLLFPLLCAFILPNLLLLASLRGVLLESEQMEERMAELDDPGSRTQWQWSIDRLQGSTHIATDLHGNPINEGHHILLGFEYGGRFPVIIPKEMLRGHTYICGTTGGNKTSIGITGILLQVMRGQTSATEKEQLPPPIVIIDLKGDMALFQTVKAQAEANGQTFRFFTPELKKETHHFVPFETLNTEWRSTIQLCQLVLEALSLDHGFGYGRSFYTGVARSALLQALQHPTQPNTFEDLYRIVARIRRGNALQDCLELLTAIESLAQYPQLRPTKKKDHTINFKQVLEQREVVYFWLPMSEPMSSREIAKLAIFALFTAALDRQRAGLPTVEMYLILDEVQRVISRGLDIILQQARSAGIAAILANQSMMDLKTPDADLRALIKTCTRVQMYFSVTEYEARSLSEMAGKEIMLMKSFGESTTRFKMTRQRSRTVSYLESFQERLPIDKILSVSSDPMGMIACFGIEGGYARFGGRPVLVRTMYPLPVEVYEARSKAEWPTGEGVEEMKAMPAHSVEIEFEESSVAATMDSLIATELAASQRR